MNADAIRTLFDYNTWANRRLWNCVAALTDDQFTRPTDYSMGSVHGQVAHMAGTDWLWLQRLRGVSPGRLPDASDYPTRDAVRAAWDDAEAALLEYVGSLRDSRLMDTLTYRSLRGDQERATPLWQVLLHVINHSTDHRAQTLRQIHEVGGATIEQDLLFYTWE